MDYHGFFGLWLSITIIYYDDKGWWWGSRCTPWTLTDALLRMLILRAGHFFNKVSFLCLLVNIFIFCIVPCCWVSIDICCCGLSSYHYMIFLWCANGQFSCSPEEVLHACHNLLVPRHNGVGQTQKNSSAEQLPKSQVVGKTCNMWQLGSR